MNNSTNPKPQYTVGEAILIGQLMVNIPVLIIMCGFMAWWIFMYPNLGWYIFLLPGFLIAWIWWSISVPQWRKWALRKGIDEHKLQRWAVLTGLVWPKGSIFEKTEIDLEDNDKS